MKKFRFVSFAAQRCFKDLPLDIQIQFAGDLKRVQEGLTQLSDFKVLSGSWKGVIELIDNGSPAYRTVYCAKYEDTVFVLHSFTKTTNGVDRKAMRTVETRHKQMLDLIRIEKA